MSDGPPPGSGLGSLAQSARRKHLRQARTILIVVGILSALGQAAICAIELNTIHDEIQKEIRAAGPDAVIDPAEIREAEETARRFLVLFHGGAIALGVVFILLGVFVERAPVAITVVALVLFIGREIVFALVDPTNMARGWLIKFIFVVCLVKALQAAIAFQKEKPSTGVAEEFVT